MSNWLHPGLSVLHTRARYLLFVPWTYSPLRGPTAADVAARGRRAEERTRNALVDRYGTAGAEGVGIIGRRSGDRLGRLPSVQYWGLLRHLGILTVDGSLDGYCGIVAGQHVMATSLSRLHSG